jgi:hypothetical protein
MKKYVTRNLIGRVERSAYPEYLGTKYEGEIVRRDTGEMLFTFPAGEELEVAFVALRQALRSQQEFIDALDQS